MLADKEFGMLTINGIPIGPIFGGTQPVRQEGMLTSGDLVTVTSDGIDLNALWNSFAESISIYNEAMDDLIELLTYPVTTPIEPVVQIGELTFEEASETKYQGGHFWTPITPTQGSTLHAGSHASAATRISPRPSPSFTTPTKCPTTCAPCIGRTMTSWRRCISAAPSAMTPNGWRSSSSSMPPR